MKKIILSILVLVCTTVFSQKKDTLLVYYYENFPLSFAEGSQVKGIEADIIREYVSWMKQKRSVDLVPVFKPFNDFGAFYAAVKSAPDKVIGLGSVSRTADREKEVAFAPPYLRNVSVLITAGAVPTVRSREDADVASTLCRMTAQTVANSSHHLYLETLKKRSCRSLQVNTAASQNAILDAIVSNPDVFGYVDLIAYWSYLKKNPGKFLKIQKPFSESQELLGFIMPLQGRHRATIGEFFESGFGFTSTKAYRQLLEKYLGYEIIESVEIN